MLTLVELEDIYLPTNPNGRKAQAACEKGWNRLPCGILEQIPPACRSGTSFLTEEVKTADDALQGTGYHRK
jgi:transcriptional accessory protein Tex/SPT6